MLKSWKVSLFLVALLLVSFAEASPITYTLGLGNQNLLGTGTACGVNFCDNYGTVSLNQNGNNVDVSVTLTSPLLMFGNGAPGAFGFNYGGNDANSLTVSSLSAGFSFNGSSPSGTGTAGSQQIDGFGTYEFIIKDGPASQAHGSLSFTVGLTAGGLLSVADLYEANSGGHHFAAHLINRGITCGGAQSGCTGDVTDVTPTTQPPTTQPPTTQPPTTQPPTTQPPTTQPPTTQPPTTEPPTTKPPTTQPPTTEPPTTQPPTTQPPTTQPPTTQPPTTQPPTTEPPTTTPPTTQPPTTQPPTTQPPVPEPASLVLLGSGLLGLVRFARKRRK